MLTIGKMPDFLPDLVSLDLSMNKFTDQFAPELFTTIMKFKNLRELDLSMMNFSDEGIELLGTSLLPEIKNLQSLNLTSNRIQKPMAALNLGKGLLACKSLRHLTLKRMRLNNVSLKMIARGFSYKLVSLHLDQNKISDECMAILAEQIRKGEGNLE